MEVTRTSVVRYVRILTPTACVALLPPDEEKCLFPFVLITVVAKAGNVVPSDTKQGQRHEEEEEEEKDEEEEEEEYLERQTIRIAAKSLEERDLWVAALEESITKSSESTITSQVHPLGPVNRMKEPKGEKVSISVGIEVMVRSEVIVSEVLTPALIQLLTHLLLLLFYR